MGSRTLGGPGDHHPHHRWLGQGFALALKTVAASQHNSCPLIRPHLDLLAMMDRENYPR